MDNIKLNSFENICRTCMYTSDLIFIQDNEIIDVLQFLSGNKYSKTDEFPQKLCLKCIETMKEIQWFAFKCQQTHLSLINLKNNQKSLPEKETINSDNIIVEFVGIKQEIIEDMNNHGEKDETRRHSTLINCLKQPINNQAPILNIIEITNNDKNNLELLTEHFVKEELLFEQNVAKEEIKNEEPSEIQDTSQDSFDNTPVANNPRKRRTRRILGQHETNERRYECGVCMKGFKRSSHLNDHKRVHSGERPYQCEVCNKAFSIKSNLLKHKGIHSDERRFECETCMKSFKQLAHLIEHKRIHTGERPYQCEVCNKKFKSKSSLVTHKATHDIMRRFECEVCLKTLKSLQCLKQHKLLHGD